MRPSVLAVLFFASLLFAQQPKPLDIDPADLVRLADKTMSDKEKKSLQEKYHDKTVRFTTTAHTTVLAPTVGNGFVTQDAKTKGEAMVFPAKQADFNKIETILATKKNVAAVVVEGKAQFPGPLSMPAVVDAKVISVKVVPR